MNLQEKEAIVADLNTRFAENAAVYLVNYAGITCAELTGLRRQLRTTDCELAIIKNTLAKRALADHAEAADLNQHFTGPTAVVWSKSDPIGPAKVLTKFAKDQEKFSVKAGLVDGKVVDSSAISSLASLPSKEQLFSQLLALLNAPATRLLQTMNEPAASLVRLLDAWRSEQEKK